MIECPLCDRHMGEGAEGGLALQQVTESIQQVGKVWRGMAGYAHLGWVLKQLSIFESLAPLDMLHRDMGRWGDGRWGAARVDDKETNIGVGFDDDSRTDYYYY